MADLVNFLSSGGGGTAPVVTVPNYTSTYQNTVGEPYWYDQLLKKAVPERFACGHVCMPSDLDENGYGRFMGEEGVSGSSPVIRTSDGNVWTMAGLTNAVSQSSRTIQMYRYNEEKGILDNIGTDGFISVTGVANAGVWLDNFSAPVKCGNNEAWMFYYSQGNWQTNSTNIFKAEYDQGTQVWTLTQAVVEPSPTISQTAYHADTFYDETTDHFIVVIPQGAQNVAWAAYDFATLTRQQSTFTSVVNNNPTGAAKQGQDFCFAASRLSDGNYLVVGTNSGAWSWNGTTFTLQGSPTTVEPHMSFVDNLDKKLPQFTIASGSVTQVYIAYKLLDYDPADNSITVSAATNVFGVATTSSPSHTMTTSIGRTFDLGSGHMIIASTNQVFAIRYDPDTFEPLNLRVLPVSTDDNFFYNYLYKGDDGQGYTVGALRTDTANTDDATNQPILGMFSFGSFFEGLQPVPLGAYQADSAGSIEIMVTAPNITASDTMTAGSRYGDFVAVTDEVAVHVDAEDSFFRYCSMFLNGDVNQEKFGIYITGNAKNGQFGYESGASSAYGSANNHFKNVRKAHIWPVIQSGGEILVTYCINGIFFGSHYDAAYASSDTSRYFFNATNMRKLDVLVSSNSALNLDGQMELK